MGAESGTNDPDVAVADRRLDREERRVLALLEREPYLFDFFQAVRLLDRLHPERRAVGEFSTPQSESVRFGAHVSMAFPASQIQSLEVGETGPPLMRVNFLGAVGPLGVLPWVYTELVADRVRARDYTMRDFLDLFQHRMISLFYQAWEKFRFQLAYERREPDRVGRHIRDLIGLGTRGLEDRQAVEDDSLVYYGGLLSQMPRSAVALEQLVSDYFDVPAEVEQFAGAWYPLDTKTQCCFRDDNTQSEQLGCGAVVGDEVWDQQSVVRIKIGPLSLERYSDFLPDGSAYQPLRDLTKFFAGNEMDFEVQLVLDRQDVPAPELGKTGAGAPRLGWVSWAKSVEMDRDPGDTILRL